jgi:hypothetical protein
METYVLSEFARDKIKVIRYADDFIVLWKNLSGCAKIQATCM